MDKEVFHFRVLWAGWELDSHAWVMKRPDGTHYLCMTNHGEEYEAGSEELNERIAAYERAISDSREALRLINMMQN
jgi:hypothetical protein